MAMQVSVVIATHNRRHLLAHTLPSILEQEYPATDYEIVLVDDGSTDGTTDYLRALRTQCGLEVIRQEKQGPAAARNAGIAAAGGDLVLFLDDDIRCDAGLVREHMEGHRAEQGVLVHGAIFLAPESPTTLAAWSTGEWYRSYNAEVEAAGELRLKMFLNANSSLSTAILRDFGGFDETVAFPREDFEMGLRIWKAGVPFRYRPHAAAYEVFIKPSQAFARQDAGGWGRAEIAISRKHPDHRPYSVLAPSDRDTPLRRSARRIIRRLPRNAESILDPPVEVMERLMHRPRARAAGMRLLGLQVEIVRQRGAREAAGSAHLLEEEFARSLPVFLYHRIGEGPGGLHPGLTVTPRSFERHVTWLARRGFTGVRPSDWQAWRQGAGRLPPRPVLFTFDDAYAELCEFAFPVLRRHGFGALVFVVTGSLGGTNTWDPDGAKEREARLMTGSQVAKWSGEGIDFGAHGRTHRDLTGLSATELADEVHGSRHDLEGIVGRPVTCFAYPFGRHAAVTREAVAESYELAFTAEPGMNDLRTAPHLLRRSAIGPYETMLDVEWRARFGRAPLPRVMGEVGIRPLLRRLGGPRQIED